MASIPGVRAHFYSNGDLDTLYLGVAFVFIGISQVILSFRLKKWNKQIRNVE